MIFEKLMRPLRMAATLLLLAAAGPIVAGCATGTPFGNFVANVKTIVTSVENSTVPAVTILAAATVFDGVKKTATQYFKLKPCGTMPCRDPQLTATIDDWIQKGTAARNTAKQFVKDHPGQLGPQGTYDALVSATSALQAIIKDNNIGS